MRLASRPRAPRSPSLSCVLRKNMLTLHAVEAALRAIAAPRRRQILTLVRDDELSAGEIASDFGVTRPASSQPLNVLKEAGLGSARRDGTRRLSRARPAGLAEPKEA